MLDKRLLLQSCEIILNIHYIVVYYSWDSNCFILLTSLPSSAFFITWALPICPCFSTPLCLFAVSSAAATSSTIRCTYKIAVNVHICIEQETPTVFLCHVYKGRMFTYQTFFIIGRKFFKKMQEYKIPERTADLCYVWMKQPTSQNGLTCKYLQLPDCLRTGTTETPVYTASMCHLVVVVVHCSYKW